MPTPSPLRLAIAMLAAVLMTAALYFFVQGAVMLYELYQFMEWVEEFGE